MQYTDISAFLRALNKGHIPGVILWRGASLIDGAPIVLVANRFDAASENDKTGAMVQTWILPDPRAHGIEVNGSRPAKISAWIKETGARSICGDCPHAWKLNPETGEHEKGSCYVREYQAPAATLGGVYRGACSGAGGKGARMPSVFIPAHGATGGCITGAECPAAMAILNRMVAA